MFLLMLIEYNDIELKEFVGIARKEELIFSWFFIEDNKERKRQMKKTFLTLLALVLCIVSVVAFADSEKIKISFYGRIDEDLSTPDMVAELKDHFKDKYEIDMIQVDWGQLDRVIKTGIASGKPSDIYFYWPNLMASYVSAGQAADLTPYLEANDGEWKKTFNQEALAFGLYDGKYYSVPIIQQSVAFYANKALFEQAGVAIPEGAWSWEEFIAACRQIDEKTDAFPFALTGQADVQSWLIRNACLGLAKDYGIFEEWAAGEVPGDHEMYRIALENIKQLYDGKYVYPGDGAMTVSREETKAAFIQGKAAILAEVWTEGKPVSEQCDFEVVAIEWPRMGENLGLTGGANGFFIPVNCNNMEAAVEVLKYYLGKEVQTINAAYGLASTNVEVEVTDPVTKKLLEFAKYVAPKEFWSINTKLIDFRDQRLQAEYLLGTMSLDDILAMQEELRQEVLADME